MGRVLPLLRLGGACRNVRLHRDPRRRARLRLAEGRAHVVLSSPRPPAGLATAVTRLAGLVGVRATVSTLHDLVVIDVAPEQLLEVARLLRDEFDFYSVNAGVDTGSEIRSVTFVRSIASGLSLMLRTACRPSDPHLPSLTAVWPGANWCERETYDMFGIVFDGHPDLRRIFLEESFPGHPLRKAFLPPRSDARGG
ncbi:MAG: NADH-quinone oxidoreductase subunit C [Chloroflexi bacterium]|nr:NADH-quinone oxidoreductase subunit C [Chloroflexota bacterium]